MLFKLPKLKTMALIGVLILSSCIPMPDSKKGDINLGDNAKVGLAGPAAVQGVQVNHVSIKDGKLDIKGKNLKDVLGVQLIGPNVNEYFIINSKNNNSIIAEARKSLGILVGTAFDLLLHEAQGATSFPVSFDIPDGAITSSKLHHMNAADGQILKWNSAAIAWEPSNLNSLTFKGTWDVNNNTPDISGTSPQQGHYYVVSVTGTSDLHDPGNSITWNVGDWATFNGTAWERINNSGGITSVNGKIGPTVSLILKDLSDVDTLTPNANDSLVWDGTKWKPTALNFLGAGGNSVNTADIANSAVTTAKIGDNSISNVKLVDGSVDSNKINDGSIMNIDVNASANIDSTKLGSGSIDNVELGYLDNVSGNLQTQLDSMLKLDGSRSMTGDLNMGTKNINNVGQVGNFNFLSNTINPLSTSSGDAGQIKFKELDAAGNNYVGLRSPDSLSTNLIFTLPGSVGTANYVLKTDGTAGNLFWGTVDRSIISAGIADHILINDSAGVMSSEANLSIIRGGTNNGSYVLGSVVYYDGSKLAEENDKFFWDSGNDRLGVGTNTPAAGIHLKHSDPTNTAVDSDHRNAITIQASENLDESGIAFQNSAGQYSWNIYRKDVDGSESDFIIAGGDTNFDITTLTERFVIKNTGEVGINTSTPTVALDVVGDAKFTGTVTNIGVTNIDDIQINSNTISSTPANGHILLTPNGSGNVGIASGAQAPSDKLMVGDGTTAAATNIQINAKADQEAGLKLSDAGDEKWFLGQGAGNDNFIVRRTTAGPTVTTDMIIDSTGKVGLGATTPTASLDIYRTASPTVRVRDDNSGIQVTNAGGVNSLQSANVAASVMTGAADLKFTDFAAANSWMMIKADGKIGVGNDSPASQVHIGEAASATNQVLTIQSTLDTGIDLIADFDNTNENDNAYLFMSQDNGTTSAMLGLVGIAGKDSKDVAYTDSLANALLIYQNDSAATDDFVQIGTAGAVRMTVREDGKVGIGTNAPDTAFEVEASGGGYVQVKPSEGGIEIASDDDANSYVDFKGNTNKAMDYIGKIEYIDGTGMKFHTNVAERMIIDNSGKVGLGTSTPAELLHLEAGNQKFTGSVAPTITMESSGTSDANAGEIFMKESGDSGWKIRHNSLGGPLTDPFEIFRRSPGSDSLALVIDGASNNYNVGIGASAPASRLHVYEDQDEASAIIIGTQGTSSLEESALNLITKGDGTKIFSDVATKGWNITAKGDAWGTAADQNDLILSFDDLGTTARHMILEADTGDMGLGIAAPLARLHVDGLDANNDQLHLSNGGAGNKVSIQMKHDSASGGLLLQQKNTGEAVLQNMATPNSDLEFWDNTAMRMIIEEGGDVGIATSDPTTDFQVGDSATAGTIKQLITSAQDTALELIADTGDSGENYNPHVLMTQDGGVRTVSMGLSGEVGGTAKGPREESILSLEKDAFVINVDDTSGAFPPTAASPEAIQFATNNEVRMSVTNDGVGVGIVSPGVTSITGDPVALRVQGWAKVDDLETGSLKLIGTNPNLTVKDNVNLESVDAYQGTYSGLDSADTEVFEVGDYNASGKEIGLNAKTANYSLIFGTNDTERMRIDDAGLVGIGTSTPTFPFHAVYTANTANFDRTDADHTNRDVLRLTRSRSDGTAPNAGFGPSLVFALEGFSNGNIFEGARIITGWETVQNDDAAARDTYMSFTTALNNSTSEAMRINSAGDLGIGTTSPAANGVHINRPDNETAELFIAGVSQGGGLLLVGQSTSDGGGLAYDGDGSPDIVGANDQITFFRRDSGTDTAVFSYPYNSNTVSFTGSISVSSNVTANAYFYSSDERLKENIQTVDSALEKVLDLRGVKFDWKESKETTYGFIAQEVEQIFPELVNRDEKGMMAVQYGNIIAPVIEAIKEQQDIIVRNKEMFKLMHNGLKAKVDQNSRAIASLKEENEKLKYRLNQVESELKEIKDLLKKRNP